MRKTPFIGWPVQTDEANPSTEAQIFDVIIQGRTICLQVSVITPIMADKSQKQSSKELILGQRDLALVFITVNESLLFILGLSICTLQEEWSSMLLPEFPSPSLSYGRGLAMAAAEEVSPIIFSSSSLETSDATSCFAAMLFLMIFA